MAARDVLNAWIALELPAVDVHYAPEPASSLRPIEERRTSPQPLQRMYKRVAHAGSRRPGMSMDVIGTFLKLPDGRVFRDRRTARRHLARRMRVNPRLRDVVSGLPKSPGAREAGARGLSAGRVLDALVARSLVDAGLSQIDAAKTVASWRGESGGNWKHIADRNRDVWRRLRVPPVAASGGPQM